ncbi:MAG: tetratricopeptide repeat protein [Alphaproteobacteria bacterium]|nr:tetratricopeptide repeat protein [Alphaproteobacteria bacterium]
MPLVLLTKALGHHRAGRLNEAESLYLQALKAAPDHEDARRLLAVLKHQMGRSAEALADLDLLLKDRPPSFETQSNRAVVLAALGRAEEAESAFRQALALDSSKAEPHAQLASLLLQLGRWDEALPLFEKAEALKPGLLGASTLQSMGVAHHKAGRVAKAEDFYRQALATKADFPPALVNLAALLEETERLDEACALLAKAQLHSPSEALIPFNLGNVLKKLGRSEEAMKAWEQALAIDPDMNDAALNLADALVNAGQAQEAESLLRDRLGDDPRLLHMLSRAVMKQDRPEEALALLDAALPRAPDHAAMRANRGEILRLLERHGEALTDLRQAIAQNPNHPEAHFNLGNILRETGRLPEAVQAYDKALDLSPGDDEIRWNRTIALLCQGRLQEGWNGYELRWHASRHMRSYPQPLWDGVAPLAGKTVFVWREQGVGDEISFASALPDLIGLAGHVILECSAKLAPLMKRSFPGITIADAPPEAFDFHLPIGSLFRHFRRHIEDFPPQPSYLQAAPASFGLGEGFKVGLAWRSTKSTVERARHFLSDPLALAPILKVPGVRFINLQARPDKGEIERLRELTGADLTVVSGLDLYDDLDGTASLMKQLDLVIANGSVTAMLAASLGIPTWMFFLEHVHWDALGSDGIPWLPGITLLKRKVGQPWTSAVEEAASALTARSNV